MDVISEDTSSDVSQEELNTDISPVSKSRYGRTRKPKISEDFYDIDVIFENSKEFKKSPRPQIPIKPVKVKQSVSKKVKDTVKQQLKVQKFEHVTADLMMENTLDNQDLNDDSKAIHNFFKSESGMSVLQNTSTEPTQKSEIKSSSLSNELNLEQVDVTQVLKIISTKSSDEKVNTELRVSTKPVLKTYTNKRKSYNKMSVVESFGLPDKPIFPIEQDKLTQNEPKRIKNLDVAAPSSENDINLVDKKLLHTPWKIASMDAEIPDIDLLIESACDEYREETTSYSMESPVKVLNEVPSIFVEPCEFETDNAFSNVEKCIDSTTQQTKFFSSSFKTSNKECDLEENGDKAIEVVSNEKEDLKINLQSDVDNYGVIENTCKNDNIGTIAVNTSSLKDGILNNSEAVLPNSSQTNEDVCDDVATSTVVKKTRKSTQLSVKQKSKDKVDKQTNSVASTSRKKSTDTTLDTKDRKLELISSSHKSVELDSDKKKNADIIRKAKASISKALQSNMVLMENNTNMDEKMFQSKSSLQITDKKNSPRKKITNTESGNKSTVVSENGNCPAMNTKQINVAIKDSPQKAIADLESRNTLSENENKPFSALNTDSHSTTGMKRSSRRNAASIEPGKTSASDEKCHSSVSATEPQAPVTVKKSLRKITSNQESSNTSVIVGENGNGKSSVLEIKQQSPVEVKKLQQTTLGTESTTSLAALNDNQKGHSFVLALEQQAPVTVKKLLRKTVASPEFSKTPNVASENGNSKSPALETNQQLPVEVKRLLRKTTNLSAVQSDHEKSQSSVLAVEQQAPVTVEQSFQKTVVSPESSNATIVRENADSKSSVLDIKQQSPVEMKKSLRKTTAGTESTNTSAVISDTEKCESSTLAVQQQTSVTAKKSSRKTITDTESSNTFVVQTDTEKCQRSTTVLDEQTPVKVKKSLRNTIASPESGNTSIATENVSSNNSLLKMKHQPPVEVKKSLRKATVGTESTNSSTVLSDNEKRQSSILALEQQTPVTVKKLLRKTIASPESGNTSIITENASSDSSVLEINQQPPVEVKKSLRKATVGTESSNSTTVLRDNEKCQSSVLALEHQAPVTVKKSLRKTITSPESRNTSNVNENTSSKSSVLEIKQQPPANMRKSLRKTTPETSDTSIVNANDSNKSSTLEIKQQAAVQVKKSLRKSATGTDCTNSSAGRSGNEKCQSSLPVEQQAPVAVKKSLRKTIVSPESSSTSVISENTSEKSSILEIKQPPKERKTLLRKTMADAESISAVGSDNEQCEGSVLAMKQQTPVAVKKSLRKTIASPEPSNTSIVNENASSKSSVLEIKQQPPVEVKKSLRKTTAGTEHSNFSDILNESENYQSSLLVIEPQSPVEMKKGLRKTTAKSESGNISAIISEKESCSTLMSDIEQQPLITVKKSLRKTGNVIDNKNDRSSVVDEEQQPSVVVKKPSRNTISKSESGNTSAILSENKSSSTSLNIEQHPPVAVRKSMRKTIGDAESSNTSIILKEDKRSQSPVVTAQWQLLKAVKKSPRKLASTLRLERENLNNQLLLMQKEKEKLSRAIKEINKNLFGENSSNSKEFKTNASIVDEKQIKGDVNSEQLSNRLNEVVASTNNVNRRSRRHAFQKDNKDVSSLASELEKIGDLEPKESSSFSNLKQKKKENTKNPSVEVNISNNDSQVLSNTSLSNDVDSPVLNDKQLQIRRRAKKNNNLSPRSTSTIMSPLPLKRVKTKNSKVPVVMLEARDLNCLSENINKKNTVLSLKKQNLMEPLLNPEDVTPPVTSPVKSFSLKRKRPQSQPESYTSEIMTEPQQKQLCKSSPSVSKGKVNVRHLRSKSLGKITQRSRSKTNKIVQSKPETKPTVQSKLKTKPIIHSKSEPKLSKSETKSTVQSKSETKQEIVRGKQKQSKTLVEAVENNSEIKMKLDEKGANSSVAEFDEMSKEIKQEAMDEMNDNSSPYNMLETVAQSNLDVKIGDLMWAKIRGHPFWPCMIVQEPTTQQYRKIYRYPSAKSTSQTLYHVRFFGDKGRRSWVKATYLVVFKSGLDLKQRFQHSKNKANFIVKPSALTNWKIAVDEAESLLSYSVKERFDFFTEMFLKQKQKKLKLPEPEVTVKEEPPEDTPVIEKDSSKKSKTAVETNTKVTNDLKKTIAEEPVLLEAASDVTHEIHSLNVKEETEASVTSEVISESTLKSPFEGSEKNIDAISEYSFSDTDTASKSSSNAPIVDSYQDQIVRQKRNNLFRGIGKERVCQICTQPNEVFKCRLCKELYHVKCANIEIKSEEEIDKPVSKPDSTEQTSHAGEDLQAKDSDKSNVIDSTTLSKVIFDKLSIAEQIDMKMKEVMQHIENDTRYADSTTDYSSSEESTYNMLGEKVDEPKDQDIIIKHVTADHVSFIRKDGSEDLITETSEMTKVVKSGLKKNSIDKEPESSTNANKIYQCGFCLTKAEPPCFACGKNVSNKNESLRQRCSLYTCGKFYHPKCVKLWPQTQWSFISKEKPKNSEELLDTFVCPFHFCHTCSSDDPRAAISRCYSSKLARCLHCPAAYHPTNYCIPAGTQILSTSQIICPRHFKASVKKGKVLKKVRTVNTPWCFICSKGGDLICCETCPTSVHAECLTINFMDDDTFVCEDCESGRFPLYDEIVWVKLGKYRWWPAVILFPNEVPSNIRLLPHNGGEFVVKFFGSHDHYWVGRGRVFLFQEGDKGHCSPSKKRVDTLFRKSIEEATIAHTIKKMFRKSKEAEIKNVTKPPPYIRVKVNKPVGNVRLFDGNVSNTTSCECNPLQENPCGPDSDCINRLLLTECDPNICPAKDKCNNQKFEKRQYPPLVPYKTQARGWGLKTLAPINKGDFVIEYVGEIIDDQEYQRRIRKMHEKKDENYYFLTIDTNRIIDAGPKGNLARFMNHCCQPNCVTQKWTVNGDTRVGLFAIENIAAESELTFNYNLECIGKEKKICNCGAPNCSGFIGVKVKDESQKKVKKSNSIKKKKPLSENLKNDGPCFVCGNDGDVLITCHNKICTKQYHLACINLENWPEGKWVCPWHNCNICTKRTIRCCVKCTNSYCPVHSEGKVRYDKLLGFVCSVHDSTTEEQTSEQDNQIVKNVKNSSLSTDEADVTSTTGDYDGIEIIKEDYIPSDVSDLVTSTPIKKSLVASSEDTHVNQNIDALEISQSSIPEDNDESLTSTSNRKRKRIRPKKTRSLKKLKLSKSIIKPNLNFNTPSLLEIPLQNEVKLCSSIPTRHLRTTRSSGTSIVNKRFLRHQNELEKDLPIRKRSRPRCEITL